MPSPWSRRCICPLSAVWPSVWLIIGAHHLYPVVQEGFRERTTRHRGLLIALLRTLWRLSYADMRDWLRSWPALALACGLPLGKDGRPRIPSPSQRCKRGKLAGAPLPEALFILSVLGAIRARLIGARDLIINPANSHDAPFAQPLLAWAVHLYQIRPRVIRLDAASVGLTSHYLDSHGFRRYCCDSLESQTPEKSLLFASHLDQR